MTTFRFEYPDDKQITAQRADEANLFLWLAYAQNSDGNCIIKKQYAFQPDQTFFSLERAVDNIPKFGLDLNTTNLYVAYEDSTLFGEVISLNNPLTITTEIPFPAGINESPIAVVVDGSDIWYLTPGSATGENAKLVRFDTSGVFQETIDLTKSGLTVNNASTMDVDSATGDIWIGTFEDPSRLIRVFEISGGLFDFSEN